MAYEVNCEQYADDTTLSETSVSIDEISDKLTNSCQRVSNWMSENQLKLNPDKTHKLTVGTAQRLSTIPHNINVTMDGFSLKESQENYETILGIEVQNNLKWNVYISNLISYEFWRSFRLILCVRGECL